MDQDELILELRKEVERLKAENRQWFQACEPLIRFLDRGSMAHPSCILTEPIEQMVLMNTEKALALRNCGEWELRWKCMEEGLETEKCSGWTVPMMLTWLLRH